MLTKLEEALAEAVSFFELHDVSYMLIGAMAGNAWGIERTTTDVDFTVALPEAASEGFIKDALERFQPRRRPTGDILGGAGILLLWASNGVGIDFIIATTPFEEAALERAQPLSLAGRRVCVISPEDLIVLKLIAGRGKDLIDIQAVVRRQRATIDRRYLDPLVAEFSAALDAPRIQEHYDEAWALAADIEEP
ncbi:MAG: nucleotidyl transferase AbiEii/AbiGii toxin family protein [Dehalococcoidia bacterium]